MDIICRRVEASTSVDSVHRVPFASHLDVRTVRVQWSLHSIPADWRPLGQGHRNCRHVLYPSCGEFTAVWNNFNKFSEICLHGGYLGLTRGKLFEPNYSWKQSKWGPIFLYYFVNFL